MALPSGAASKLAADLAKRGVSSAPSSLGSQDDDSPEDDSEASDPLQSVISDVADAVVSGDKDSIVKFLSELVDRLRSEDEDQDQEDQQ